MPQQVIDAFDTVAAWTPVQADGVTASTAITLTSDPMLFRWGDDHRALRLTTAAGTAQNHRIRRTLPSDNDLTRWDEIRLSVRSDRATGDINSNFFLEFRIGSTALPPGSPDNGWHRRLPVRQPNRYETVRLSLADLPPAIRAAVRILEFRVLSAQPLTVWLDDLSVVRVGIVEDADEALRLALHNRTTIGGNPVPVVFPLPDPDDAPDVALPHLSVRNVGIQLVPARTGYLEKTDFTADGFSTRGDSIGCDLFYEIEARAGSRVDQAQLIQFVLATLPPTTATLPVVGMERSVRWEDVPPFVSQVGGLPAMAIFPLIPADRLRLRYKLSTTLESATPPAPARPPFAEVRVGVDDGSLNPR